MSSLYSTMDVILFIVLLTEAPSLWNSLVSVSVFQNWASSIKKAQELYASAKQATTASSHSILALSRQPSSYCEDEAPEDNDVDSLSVTSLGLFPLKSPKGSSRGSSLNHSHRYFWALFYLCWLRLPFPVIAWSDSYSNIAEVPQFFSFTNISLVRTGNILWSKKGTVSHIVDLFGCRTITL